MGCAMGIIKYLVFLFNLVFAVAGLAMLVIGVICQVTLNDTTKAIDDNVAVAIAPTLLIIIGAIVFVISFFGCCGAVKESTCMLTTYAVILLALFILQIAFGVFAFLHVQDENGDFKKDIRRGLDQTMKKYYSDPPSQEAFDLLQQTLKCCGIDGPTDWHNRLPRSCCQKNSHSCYLGDPSLFEEGCNRKLYTSIVDNVQILGYVALGLCVTEIVAAIFSLCLSSSIRNDQRRSGYA